MIQTEASSHHATHNARSTPNAMTDMGSGWTREIYDGLHGEIKRRAELAVSGLLNDDGQDEPED